VDAGAGRRARAGNNRGESVFERRLPPAPNFLSKSVIMNVRLAAAAALAVVFSAQPARAQAVADSVAAANVRTQAISVLPLHVMFGFYAGDYERAVNPTTTLGAGGSYYEAGDGDNRFQYASAEAKLRYYPSADVLSGLSFGLTAGPTWVSADDDFDGVSSSATALGIGFEIARSHLMGVDRRFYYGYGGGLKRLFIVNGEAEGSETTLPTLRLSVGYAF
jgi:hypothetical protein